MCVITLQYVPPLKYVMTGGGAMYTLLYKIQGEGILEDDATWIETK